MYFSLKFFSELGFTVTQVGLGKGGVIYTEKDLDFLCLLLLLMKVMSIKESIPRLRQQRFGAEVSFPVSVIPVPEKP